MRGVRTLQSVCVLALMTSLVLGQSVGPDVIVGDIPDISNYGTNGGLAGYSVGTTSCNLGTTDLLWISSTPDHPVIAQNLYRMKDGRFEHIGVNWLKHGFLALSGNVCGTCTGSGGSVLNPGCSDPYSSGLNGGQSPLGARSEVNAATGIFPYPRILVPPVNGNDRRLECDMSAVDPSMNAGARYFVEAHYIAADDAAAGNDDNNASYREVQFSGGLNMSFVGTTQREKPAVLAWADNDSGVTVESVDIPNDGRLNVAYKVEDLGNGMYRHTYVIHNLNSDRSVSSLDVALSAGATVTNPYFHDVDYRAGEVWDGTDWTYSTVSGGVNWVVATAGTNANAIRWSSSYSFGFDADEIAGDITLGLFKAGGPGDPTSMTVTPNYPTPQWETNSAAASMDINGLTNNAFDGPILAELVAGSTGHVLTMDSTNISQPFDLFWTFSSAVPSYFTTANDQILNVNLTDPTFGTLNNFFGAPFPGTITLPFGVAPVNADIALQFATFDPSHPDGFAISAANEIQARVAPTVMVEASGANSYINNNVQGGFWRVHHAGNSALNITSVTLSFSGVSARYFDTDQTSMGGDFTLGGTYRGASAAACGLDFSVSTPFANSGWIGTNGGVGTSGTAANFQTLEFQFTGGLFNAQSFAFDVDTDSGPFSQNGASQAGMMVTVLMSDGSTATAPMAADPNNTDRAFVTFF